MTNQITEELIHHINTNSNLRVLSLVNANLSNSSTLQLSQYLLKNTNLKELGISWNKARVSVY